MYAYHNLSWLRGARFKMCITDVWHRCNRLCLLMKLISSFLDLKGANEEMPSVTVTGWTDRNTQDIVARGCTNTLQRKGQHWLFITSHSNLPFCLRTDRSVWRNCMHCSTFPLCIHSNMSPPLTEQTGIGCIVTGAHRSLQPAFTPTEGNCNGHKITSSDEALLHHNVKRERRTSFAAK